MLAFSNSPTQIFPIPLAAETLVNTVRVTTQEYPTEVKKTWTQVKPYLSVTVTDSPDPIAMLNILHYRLAVALNHHAPHDATGVTLVSQLPQGIELKSIHSDDGVCDTSALPQITCQLNDLSIAQQPQPGNGGNGGGIKRRRLAIINPRNQSNGE